MLFVVNIENFKIHLKIFIIYNIIQKPLVLSIIWSKCLNEDEKFFKEEESILILKRLDLIENIFTLEILVKKAQVKNIDE